MQPRHERFRRLIEPVHDRALTFARGLSRSRADGDDLFQEALVRALDKLDGLRDDAAFRPWLYRVIISVHRNQARRAFWRRLLPLGDHARAETATPAPDDELGGAERARLALASLPAAQREAIVLFELEGWQVDEIARLQGASASAIKSRLSRGRCYLRAFYIRRFGAAPIASSLVPGETP
jgi:RNA polymerase sigma-70 factor, ECF subfamily